MEKCCGSDNSCDWAWFKNMIPNCLHYTTAAKSQGRPIVGIMCEYTPRELIMASGGVPVCLCGGSVNTIAAAEQDLPSNLCPLIKSTYGYHVLKKNPFLEMADLLVAETTCDGKKKMYELLAQSRPMHVLELPQKPDDANAFEHWHKELLKFKAVLENRFNVRITDSKIREAISIMNRERRLRRQLAAFMKADTPPLTGRELLNFKSIISSIDADLQQYEEAAKMLASKKQSCETAKKVRVLLTGVPMVHGAERVLDIIEQNGGLVVCMENCTGIKPILEDVDEAAADPILALAKKYYSIPCSVMTANNRRLETLRELIRQYQPQCVIELIWQACLTYDVESHFVRQLVQQEFKLPYLRIETDYSPSDSPRIAVRVEALFETARGRAGENCK
jgi:benzoyl-CoA reductase/2-hydroxyglutaryl-CoA dehydratase subunit BcrC/BadD/HgdB